MEEKTKLLQAEAQFLGFFHGKWNRHDIIGLVESMGLQKKEWEKLKEDHTLVIDEDDARAVNEYFK